MAFQWFFLANDSTIVAGDAFWMSLGSIFEFAHDTGFDNKRTTHGNKIQIMILDNGVDILFSRMFVTMP